jgi:alkaline phosphatase D
MKKLLFLFTTITALFSCKNTQNIAISTSKNSTNVVAFGSCNNQKLENVLWKEIIKNKPVAWIWGGDNTYSDTDTMAILRRDYQIVSNNPDYQNLKKQAQIFATWDDHDYGLNDGGVHFKAKKASQVEFLDFMGVSKTDNRRQQEGIYNTSTIKMAEGTVKIIVLDTRYFRTDLTKNVNPKKRYQPNKYGEGTILGTAQWAWLERELSNSKADFNLIMSSIQVLSSEHGFETWGNMPHEVDKLKQTIKQSKAKGVVILSGDRHISEFSKTTIEGVNYPLIDFTSSGLTHAYEKFTTENNPYRVGEVVPKISFGLLTFDFKNKEILMQIRGKENVILGEFKQKY